LAQIREVWGATSPQEQREYQSIVAKYQNSHNSQHNMDEARKDRLSRYRSSAVTARMEQERLSHHNAIDKKQAGDLSALRRRIERRHQVA
jgi:hypothetical protein